MVSTRTYDYGRTDVIDADQAKKIIHCLTKKRYYQHELKRGLNAVEDAETTALKKIKHSVSTHNATHTITSDRVRAAARRKVYGMSNVRTTKTNKRLMVSLYIPEHFKRIRYVRPMKTNRHGFTFGHDRIPEHLSPRPEDFDTVLEILDREIKQHLKAGSFVEPAHAAKGITVDSVVRVIMSQVTGNEMASDTHQHIIRAYPYHVNGEVTYGTVPNYHSMRIESVEKLRAVLKRAGISEKKPDAIKLFLDVVHATNVAMLPEGQLSYEGNEPEAMDFVPGLLSVDYLWDILEEQGKQGLLDYLVSFPQIGVKTATCIMSFSMDVPVLGVDTHVAAMSKLLGWVPNKDNIKEDDMCSHLDCRMPDSSKKLRLHQGFWQHRRNCARCSGRVKEADDLWPYAHCSLEHLIVRDEERVLMKSNGLNSNTKINNVNSSITINNIVNSNTTTKNIMNDKASDQIPMVVRMAKYRAAKAAYRGELLVPSPNDQIALFNDNDRIRKGRRTTSSLISDEVEQAKMAAGLTKVVYKLDDNFDAAGAYVIMRTTWVPDYSRMNFPKFKVQLTSETASEQEHPGEYVEEFMVQNKRMVAVFD